MATSLPNNGKSIPMLGLLRLITALTLPLWVYALLLTRAQNTSFLPLGLLLLSVVSWWLVGRAQGSNQQLSTVLALGIFYKVSFVSIFVIILFNVYGNGDALLYHRWATQYVGDFWDFGRLPPALETSGTGFIRSVTAYLYLVTGSSLAIGMLTYGLMAFWGSFFFLRAFQVFFPKRDFRLMTVLLFFYPSLVFWTASIGKDALIFLMLGALTYRLAWLFQSSSLRNLLWLAPPFLGVTLIRPHVALMYLFAAGAAAILGRRHNQKNRFLIRVATAALFLLATALVMPLVKDRLLLEDLSLASTSEFLDWQLNATARGGSEIATSDSFFSRILKAPLSLVRPFPWEAHNLTAALAAGEGILLLGLCLARRHQLVFNLRHVGRHPFILFVVLLMLEFCVAFSSISNFGILARQRTMFLPMIFMLLSTPPSAPSIAPASRRERRLKPVEGLRFRPEPQTSPRGYGDGDLDLR